MPAVTVDNILTLPRVTQPTPDAVSRPVLSVSTAPKSFEGEGFPVRRAFAGVDMARLDPFIHMDQMGEVEYAPGEARGTSWHPHRGFETVTYIIDGTFAHEDTHGGGGLITDGDTQWMTAGSGLLHIEAPPEELVVSGGVFHGLQLWVNLPSHQKMSDPRYQDIRSGQVGLLSSHDGGALLRVIAGELDGHEGPGITTTPISMIHTTIAPGARMHIPWREDFNGLAYVLSGRGTVGPDRRPIREGQLAVFGSGVALEITAEDTQDARSASLEVSSVRSWPACSSATRGRSCLTRPRRCSGVSPTSGKRSAIGSFTQSGGEVSATVCPAAASTSASTSSTKERLETLPG